MIEAPDANGEMKTWSFEGAAIVHAARQGVNGTTYKKGENVRVVMHPMRDGRNAGALCFVVKEDGSFTRPNDGICNSDAMYARWQDKGWLASATTSTHIQPPTKGSKRAARAKKVLTLKRSLRVAGCVQESRPLGQRLARSPKSSRTRS